MDKVEILKQFIETHAHTDKQGSEGWHQVRSTIIGGSEMSVLTGDNNFSSIPRLVCEKVGLFKFHGNLATRWGRTFERITEIYIAELFVPSKKIYITGSIQHKNVHNHRYSLDGLCIIEFEGIPYITLLEFKAPLSTVPNGKIPACYVPQIKAGLCTIDIAERGLFVNNMYRKCSFQDLGVNNKFDDVFHKSTNEKDPIAFGVIFFYVTENNVETLAKILENSDSLFAEILQKFLTKTETNLLDLGKCSKFELDLFLQWTDEIIKPYYIMPQFNKDAFIGPNKSKYNIIPPQLTPNVSGKKCNFSENIDRFVKKCHNKNHVPLAMLPWKLFRSSLIIAERHNNYVDSHKEKIDEVIDMVKNINMEEHEDSKIRKFTELFPDSGMFQTPPDDIIKDMIKGMF